MDDPQMQGVPPQQSVTAWPRVSFPRPAVKAVEVDQIDDPWLGLREARHDDAEYPDDAIFFAIADADPTSVESMIDVARAMQTAVVPYGDRWSDVMPDAGPQLAMAEYFALLTPWADKCELDFIAEPETWDRLPHRPDYTKVHIAEISLRVWLAQQSVARIADKLLPDESGGPGGDVVEPWSDQRLQGMWNGMLAAFTPRIDCKGGQGDAARPARQYTGFELAYLDLFNGLNSEAGIKRCPNCGRVFSHQVAQPKPGSTPTYRRKSSIYCSPKCSSAAAVRQFRARKKDEAQT